MHFYRNSDESTTFFTQILKATIYLDFSWKTASESVGIKTTLTNFIRSVGRSLMHYRGTVFEKFAVKVRINGNSGTSSSIEQNVLYNMYELVFFATPILQGTSINTVLDDKFLFISCRRTSQSTRTTIHTFKIPPTHPLTANRNTTDWYWFIFLLS